MLKKYLFGFLFIAFSLVSAQHTSNAGRIEDTVLAVYPTVSHDMIYIKTKNSLRIKMLTFYSILGVQVQEILVPNLQTVQVELDRLKSGKYLIRCLLSDGSQKVVSVVKI